MELLTVNDVAKELKKSSSSVLLYERLGLITASRTRSGMRIFRLDDVRRFKTELESKRANQAGAEAAGVTA